MESWLNPPEPDYRDTVNLDDIYAEGHIEGDDLIKWISEYDYIKSQGKQTVPSSVETYILEKYWAGVDESNAEHEADEQMEWEYESAKHGY